MGRIPDVTRVAQLPPGDPSTSFFDEDVVQLPSAFSENCRGASYKLLTSGTSSRSPASLLSLSDDEVNSILLLPTMRARCDDDDASADDNGRAGADNDADRGIIIQASTMETIHAVSSISASGALHIECIILFNSLERVLGGSSAHDRGMIGM